MGADRDRTPGIERTTPVSAVRHVSLGLYRGYRDTGYLPFYFQGYRILSILLPGI